MGTYDLPQEPEWLVKSRMAAYCTRRLIGLVGRQCTGSALRCVAISSALAPTSG